MTGAGRAQGPQRGRRRAANGAHDKDVMTNARESGGMSDIKMWGKEPFWGLGFEFDPQWLLTDEQKKLQKTLIDLCQTSMRENAVESDKKLIYPRKNFKTLAQHGFLGLIVP